MTLTDPIKEEEISLEVLLFLLWAAEAGAGQARSSGRTGLIVLGSASTLEGKAKESVEVLLEVAVEKLRAPN